MYTIHAEGQLTANIESPNACGFNGQRAFGIELEVDTRELDATNKFVCEVNTLSTLMTRKYGSGKWRASCEQLAAAAVILAFELLTGKTVSGDDDEDYIDDEDNLLAIRAKVTPATGRFVKMTWDNGDDLPVDDLPINLTSHFSSLEEVKRAASARSHPVPYVAPARVGGCS